MFPSINPFETSSFKKPYFPSDIQNPNHKEDDPPFLFNFPSPFFDEHELPLNQILFQNHHLMAANQLVAPDQTINNINTHDPTNKDEKGADRIIIPSGINVVAPLRRRNLGVVPRRRTGKKDRHSKICTAQGIRDRRMRLSLQVARKFFDLQDMLGYDKASQTIEWLFNQSKKAIKEMTEEHPEGYNISISDAKSESFLSECEVVSGVDQENSNNDVKDQSIVPSENLMTLCIKEKDHERKPQKTASKSNMRESRDKARARARCRTREKMMIKRLECSVQKWCKSNPTDDDLQNLGSSTIPFEVVDQESNSNNPFGSSLEQQLADVGTIEKLLGNSNSDYHCSPAVSCYNTDPNTSFMGFLGNWDLLNNIHDRTNPINYGVTNQVSLAGINPSSIYLSTPKFP